MSIRRGDPVDPETVESLARRLEAYEATLSEREKAILGAIVEATMPPLERMRRRPAAEVLTGEEQAVLEKLLARRPPER